jgi:hypothetical protein
MNGPIIVNNARELLADKIFGYPEPTPAPLKISPWLAMSLLQKAIRRGEREFAQRAAATLLLIAPDRLWRRCGAAAFEEIGVADLETVSLVTAALAGKRYRATIGGEWKVTSFIVDQMVKAPKCRAADDLLATWYAAGTHPRQTKRLSARAGDAAALFDGLCEAGLPHSVVEIAREGFRKIGEPLCPFVALLCPHARCEASTLQDDDMLPAIMVGEVPGWAYDMYVREGRLGLQAFLQRDCGTARWMRDHVPAGQRVNFLGTVVFRVEGGLPTAVKMANRG